MSKSKATNSQTHGLLDYSHATDLLQYEAAYLNGIASGVVSPPIQQCEIHQGSTATLSISNPSGLLSPQSVPSNSLTLAVPNRSRLLSPQLGPSRSLTLAVSNPSRLLSAQPEPSNSLASTFNDSVNQQIRDLENQCGNESGTSFVSQMDVEEPRSSTSAVQKNYCGVQLVLKYLFACVFFISFGILIHIAVLHYGNGNGTSDNNHNIQENVHQPPIYAPEEHPKSLPPEASAGGLPNAHTYVPSNNPLLHAIDTHTPNQPNTEIPTDTPLTGFPSDRPLTPSGIPSTDLPSENPSNTPNTQFPSDTPSTNLPSDNPLAPSDQPNTQFPSDTPSTNLPSDNPSNPPDTQTPSDVPSNNPEIRTDFPSDSPISPSEQPVGCIAHYNSVWMGDGNKVFDEIALPEAYEIEFDINIVTSCNSWSCIVLEIALPATVITDGSTWKDYKNRVLQIRIWDRNYPFSTNPKGQSNYKPPDLYWVSNGPMFGFNNIMQRFEGTTVGSHYVVISVTKTSFTTAIDGIKKTNQIINPGPFIPAGSLYPILLGGTPENVGGSPTVAAHGFFGSFCVRPK